MLIFEVFEIFAVGWIILVDSISLSSIWKYNIEKIFNWLIIILNKCSNIDHQENVNLIKVVWSFNPGWQDQHYEEPRQNTFQPPQRNLFSQTNHEEPSHNTFQPPQRNLFSQSNYDYKPPISSEIKKPTLNL